MRFGRNQSVGHSTLYLYLAPEGLSILICGQVNLVTFLTAEDEQGIFDALKMLIAEHKLQNCTTHLAISRQDYQLLYIDAPNVPETEAAQAAKFLIKDLLDFPISEAAVDVFEMPPIGQQKKINVVASKIERIQNIQKNLLNLDLKLFEVTIPEIALSQTLRSLNGEENVSAIIFKGTQCAHIMIVKGADIQMIRDIGPAENLEPSGQLEALSLEVQRSLDFYQTALRGTPPAKLYLSWEITDPLFQTQFQSSVTQKVEVLPKPDTQGDITQAAVVYGLQECEA